MCGPVWEGEVAGAIAWLVQPEQDAGPVPQRSQLTVYWLPAYQPVAVGAFVDDEVGW